MHGYLHHLMKAGELLGVMLLSEVNIAYYQELTAGARAAIAAGRFAEFHAATKAGWDRGDLPPHSNSIPEGLDATPPADAK
jgi:queuine tRNA-ribosyltransferase